MPCRVADLAELVRCVDPKAMDNLVSPVDRVFGDIKSLSQVQSLWSIVSPYIIKNFQY